MSDTERLLEVLKSNPFVEVDHALNLYLEPGKKITWREVESIRENGYKIQDIENGDPQTKVTLVRPDGGSE